MPGRHLSRWYSILPLLAVLALPGTLTAQEAPACEGCVPDYAVVVTPDGTNEPGRTALTGGYTAAFTVRNSGLQPDTYDLSCSPLPSPATCSVSPAQVALTNGAQTSVTLTYSTGPAGVDTIYVTAQSLGSEETTDIGSKVVTATGAGLPLLSLAPYNANNRDVGTCLAACFDAIYTHATPPYFSLGSARSAGLVYNSATHVPMPVVWVDVSRNAQSGLPDRLLVSLRDPVAGSLLTLQNGGTVAYFTPAATGATRLAVPFPAQGGITGTGGFAVQVIVEAHYTSPANLLGDTVSTTVLINDQSGSAFGAGVGLAGLQRLVGVSPGNPQPNTVYVTDGDGSIATYWTHITKWNQHPGTFARLSYTSGTQRYDRKYMDGSSVQFDSLGRMRKAMDRFGNTTTLAWFAAPNHWLLSSITDPMGKVISFCYGGGGCTTGKLTTITSLPGQSGQRISSYTISGGLLIRAADPDGLSDSLAYGGNGLLSKVWNRARVATELYYDPLRRLDSVVGPSVALYSGSGRPTGWFVPSERLAWQPGTAGTTSGSPKTGVKADTSLKALVINPLRDTTRYALDPFGAPIKITDPYGATTLITRDVNARPTRIDEPNGHYTTFNYNPYYQLVSTADGPSGRTIGYTYRDTLTSDVATIAGDIVRQDFHYHDGSQGPAGALHKVYIGNTSAYPNLSGSAELVERRRPDALGRDTAIVDTLGHGTHLQFEGTWGNIWKAKDASGIEVRYTYDAAGRTDSTLSPLSARRKVTYGSMNQVLTQVSAGPGYGYRVSNSYDSLLAVVRVETPRVGGAAAPNVHRYAYNALGWLVAEYDSVAGARADTLKYDLGGNLRTFTPRRDSAGARTVSLTYDRVGRLRTRTTPGGIADHFRYDSLTARWAVDSNAIAVNRDSFDVRGRLTQWKQTLGGRTYTGKLVYDTQDRMVRRTILPSSPAADSAVFKVLYAANTGKRDSLCAFINPKCVTFKRNADQVADTLVYNRGTANVWKVLQGYDANHRTTSQDYTPAGLAPFDLTQVFDSIGRVRNRTSPKGGSFTRRVFTYDSLGRLTNACDSTGGQCQNVVNGSTAVPWSYDSAGNRQQVGTTTVYARGNRVQSSGGSNFVHDSSGNITCKTTGSGCPGSGSGKKYTWDPLGRLRLVQTDGGGFIDSMAYDARGRRVRKTTAAGTELYAYDGGQVVLDVNAGDGAVLREYAWFPGGVDRLFALRTGSPADTFAAVLDERNGSVRGLARFKTGAIVKEYAELPWGDVVADTGLVVRYRFAGREYDAESGLYYMRARYYDPSLGRWISEDPIGMAGGSNLYLYGGDDPVNYTDPTGTSPFGPDPPGYRCFSIWSYLESGGVAGWRICEPTPTGFGTHGGSLEGGFFSGGFGTGGQFGGGEPSLGAGKSGASTTSADSDQGGNQADRCIASLGTLLLNAALDFTQARWLDRARRLGRWTAGQKEWADLVSGVDYGLFGRAAQRGYRAGRAAAGARAAQARAWQVRSAATAGLAADQGTLDAAIGVAAAAASWVPWGGTAVASVSVAFECVVAPILDTASQ